MIEFDLDLPDVIHHIQKIEDRIIILSVRHAANKALRAAREEANSDFRKRYGVGKGKGQGRFGPKIDKLIESKRGTMASFRKGKGAFILAESHPITLIHFVMGPRKAQKFKGESRASGRI